MSGHIKHRAWVLMQGFVIIILCVILVLKLDFAKPLELICIILSFLWLLNYVSIYFYKLQFDGSTFIETQLFRPTRRLSTNQIEAIRPKAYSNIKWVQRTNTKASIEAPFLENKTFKRFPRYAIEDNFIKNLKSMNLPIKIDPNY